MGGGNYMSNSKVKEPGKYFYLKIHISFFLNQKPHQNQIIKIPMDHVKFHF